MEIKVFGKENCAKCTTTKNKLNHFLKKWDYADSATISFFDVDTMDGMAEGAFYDVGNIPTTIIEHDGSEIAKWDGEVPNSDEVKTHFERVLEKV